MCITTISLFSLSPFLCVLSCLYHGEGDEKAQKDYSVKVVLVFILFVFLQFHISPSTLSVR